MAIRHSSNNNSPDEALHILAKLAAERVDTLNQYSVSLPQSQDDDENEDCKSLIMDSFVESSGAQAEHTLTNFSLIEIHEIFDRSQEHTAKKYNRRRGKSSRFQGKDVFFMSLTLCKHWAVRISWQNV